MSGNDHLEFALKYYGVYNILPYKISYVSEVIGISLKIVPQISFLRSY